MSEKPTSGIVVMSPGGSVEDLAMGLGHQTGPAGATHQYGPRVLVTGGDADLRARLDKADSGGSFDVSADPSSDDAQQLDRTGLFGLRAFALRQSDEWQRAKAARPRDGEPWDFGPHVETPEAVTPISGEAQLSDATSERLTGSVAVGLVIVEGPGDLAFTDEEKVKVLAEVQAGLEWLGSQPVRGIRWVYDLQFVTVQVPPGPDSESQAEREHRWRHPTMRALGYTGDDAGVRNYVRDLRVIKRTDWAFCGFVTKYPLGRSAYGFIGGLHLVMKFPGPWTADNIDSVFAHETAHMFGAPDEYASSNCDCGGTWGFGRRPNGNCQTCAPDGGVACLMRANSFELCDFTPHHLGYDLQPDAEFVSQQIPSNLKVFEQGIGRVTMKNTGLTAWQPSYKLVARSTGWTVSQVPIGRPVGRGESVTVEVPLVASVPGEFTSSWQMAQFFPTQLFGSVTPRATVTVEGEDGSDDCVALDRSLRAAEESLRIWQEELKEAPPPPKGDIVREIRRVQGQIKAINRRRNELGCP